MGRKARRTNHLLLNQDIKIIKEPALRRLFNYTGVGGTSFEVLRYTTSTMKANPFFIEYLYNGKTELAEVKPCCQTDNNFYYDISIKNRYQFTITPTTDDEKGYAWKISLKNADKHVDDQLVEIIGEEIEKRLL